jgi:uncharacterized phage protein gp47/JayE
VPTNFTRPTVAALIARVQTDIEGEIAGVTARLRRRFEYGLARAIAGVAHHLHGHLAWVAEQIIVDQASEKYVLRWADFFGVARRPAVAAQGDITVIGDGAAVLLAGTEFIRLADGARYTVDAEHDPVTVSETVAVTAVDAGTSGNMVAGQTLQLSTIIPGITSQATVASGGIIDGAELESVESLRTRTLARIQQPPRGGAPGDHVTWALEVPGVYRAWEYPRQDVDGSARAGVVSIAFLTESGLPSSGLRDDVLEYAQERSPAEVLMIELQGVPLVVSIKLDPINSAVTDAVGDEIEDFLLREREPGWTLRLSRLDEAISRAAGEVRHEIVLPAADVPLDFDEIHTYLAPTINPFP